MTCSSCAATVSRILNDLPGVSKAVVDLVTNSAIVIHHPSGIPTRSLISEIESAGYGATIIETRLLNVPTTRRTRFSIEGMTCSSCTGAIQNLVSQLPGVKNLTISLLTNSMDITYDPSTLTPLIISNTIGEIGYEVIKWDHIETEQSSQATKDGRSVELKVQGMMCGDCPARANAYLESLNLISFTPLSIDFDKTKIHYKPSPTLTIREILAFPEPFRAALYIPPSLMARSRKIQQKEAEHLARLFLMSFAFSIPVFVVGVLAMILLPERNSFRMWWETPLWGGATRATISLWIMATLVQFGVGWVFYKRAYKGTFMRRKVALSTSVAYLASVGIMARDIGQGAEMTKRVGSENTYFDSSVFIIFFILMGRVLEGRAKVRTGDAIALLGSMRPQHALLVSGMMEDDVRGIEVEEESLRHRSTTSIPVEGLEIGDYILIQPGDVPPADGIIVSGATSVDESSLTGESLPVFKGKGDPLMTGTTNLTSPVIIRVNEVGDQTMLQKIVQLVAEGQSRKAPIERLADSITAIFVPLVVWFSALILIIWLSLSLSKVIPDSYLPHGRTSIGDRIFFAFGFAISCLVIACPCGIGLAAPTAQAVGSGLAAKAGILAQGGGEAFQMAAKADTVVFDKTGTLTTGNTTVTHLNRVADVPVWFFHAVRLMEAGSSHPLALAITKFCSQNFGEEESDVRIELMEEVPGKGLKATIVLADDTRYSVLIGNERFVIMENNVRLEYGGHLDAVRSQQASGQTVVFVASMKQGNEKDEAAEDTTLPTLMASFSISDTIRPHARTTVEQLRASGREVFMLTGDNEITARAVAVEVGIEPGNVVAGVLPQGKAEFINKLKERKRLVKPWHSLRAKEKRSIVAFCGDGLNDTAALTAADVGVALAQGSQITISAASFVLLSQKSILTSVYTLLKLSRRVYNRQKLNFGWAMVYNVILLPVAAGALFAHKHTRLPPVWAALAMALSSVSVVMSSLALQWGW
ncbi:E1-E2 ATPase-domain-containing protein [Cantharellus anzutake]|uniref:E1-E2 ATPase-domain-containing protein n=1 Tax=Cantharellus anzutake TaxID=1750568 RepID=UPI0019043085|nr:E1-E2 ATPase-domain-containing protein [Cantharellus anzutake]KAF8338092.1 E1-E2 ATPase-domain-containing protein [Cantharellus anzutake]